MGPHKPPRAPLRVLGGAVVGLLVGGLLVALLLVTKFGPLVDTPRSWHPAILAGLFAAPAIAGGIAGLAWRRS